MINQSVKVSLSEALDVFSENLPDIKDTLALQITDELNALPPIPTGISDIELWVREGVRKLEVKEITEYRLKVINRIAARQYYTQVGVQESDFGVTKEDIARAKEVPIAELYEGKLIRGKQGLCPFHNEKSPSFHINIEKNTWRCFGCGLFGSSVDFIMRRDSIAFIEAVRVLNKL